MGVAFWCIQEEVTNGCTGDVLVLRRHIRENNARCHFLTNPEQSGLPQIMLTQVWETKEPEYSLRDAGEDA